jgi:3-hydroxybutyryl-CoA dehydrogenase
MSAHPHHVAVVGGGLMGHGIAQVFASNGFAVTVYDARAEARASVRDRVRANLERLGEPPGLADGIMVADSLGDAVRGAQFVTEAVAEDLGPKQELFRELDRLAPPDAILATNTSVMSITEIAAAASNRARIVGTHWWNPPYLVPLVEVTPGADTTSATVQRTLALLASAGKSPVHVKKDVPGFIGNRMQHALWREAIAIVDEGIADADDVDLVVKASFGLRLPVLGPIENADLVGLDLTKAIHDYVLPHLNASPRVAPVVEERIASGDLGMKTGRGLRNWSDEEARATRERLFEHLANIEGAR